MNNRTLLLDTKISRIYKGLDIDKIYLWKSKEQALTNTQNLYCENHKPEFEVSTAMTSDCFKNTFTLQRIITGKDLQFSFGNVIIWSYGVIEIIYTISIKLCPTSKAIYYEKTTIVHVIAPIIIKI